MIRLKLNLIGNAVQESDVIESFFKVSASEDMSNPIKEIHNVSTVVTHVLETTIDIEVPDGVKYYVTGSYVTTAGGLSYTSTVVEIISNDTKDIEIENYLPQKINPPILSTPYPTNSHSYKGFIASISNIEDVLLNRHYATTWVLVRLLDNIIVESYIKDSKNITSKEFVEELLPGTYELKAKKHMLSGDVSVYGSYTFMVKSDDIVFDKYKLSIDKNLTLFINGEVKNLFVNSLTDDLHIKIHNNTGIIRDEDINTGLTEITTETDTIIEISINGKDDSSLYLYSLYKYAGNCRFNYNLPIEFC